jgi:inositol phosphorylceramide mannosyltransferase catalytic subunit
VNKKKKNHIFLLFFIISMVQVNYLFSFSDDLITDCLASTLELNVAPLLNAYSQKEPWVYVDFDESMQTMRYARAIASTKTIVGIEGEELLQFFRKLFEKNNLSRVVPTVEVKIPKIIHQIWLGSPVPPELKRYMNTWIKYHPDWEYKLWTEEDIAQLKLRNQYFYDASDNYGIKSDIARWEILYRMGGVYVDTDFECFRQLDVLNYTYDFYIALQPLDTLFVQLGIGLVGTIPGHPIIKHCIETIKDDWHEKGAPKKTGPVHFTRSFYQMADQQGLRDIAFPASYFYPLGCRENTDNIDVEAWLKKGAVGVHWWAKSWMPKSFRPSAFQSIKNDDSTKSWND